MRLLIAAVLFACAGLSAHAQSAEDSNPEANTLIIETNRGKVVVNLRPDLAPLHVARIRELARAGEYDGVAFHRVIDGFMAQTGDIQYGDTTQAYNPLFAGRGSSTLPDLPAEFSDARFERGTVGMARSQNPDSGNSQFFIMFARAAHLDKQYTVFGEVIVGMDVVDQIKRGAGRNGAVEEPDFMKTVRIAADQ